MTMTPYTLGGASNAPGTGTTLQFTLGHAAAAGDTLVVAAASDTLAETVSGVTDSKGNTWTSAGSDYNQADGLAVFYAQNVVAMTTSDTITATFSGSTGSHTITGRGCNGIATAGGPDVTVTNDNAGSTSPSSGSSGTLRQSSEWAVAFLVSANGGGTPASWSGGFTAISSQHATSNEYLTAADQTVSATTALTAGATITSAAWAMVLVTFRAAPYLAASNAFASGTTSTAVTMGSQGVASGDAVLVVCGVGAGAVVPSSVTDSQSQTYALVASETPGNGMCSYVFAAYNSAALVASTDTVTVTWNSTSNNKSVMVVGANGLPTSAAFDQSAGGSGTSAAPSSGATPALAAAGDVALNVIVGGSASVSVTPSSSWVQVGSTLHTGAGVYMAVAQRTAPTTSGVTAGGTLGTSASWSALAAAFSLVTGGSGSNGAAATLTVTSPDPLTAGTVGTPYSYQLAAANGSQPYTWSISSGSLPAGLALTSGAGGGAAGDFTYIGVNTGPQGAPTVAQWTACQSTLGPFGCYKTFWSAGGSGIYTGFLGGDVNGGGTTGFTTGLEGQLTSAAGGSGLFAYVSWGALMSAAAINNYVSSIPHTVTEVGFTFQSEPENAYALTAGKQFVADWTDQANKIRAAQSLTPVKLTLITSHFEGHYQDGTLSNSSFIPPASVVDVYGFDFYDRHNYWVGGDMSTNKAWTVWTGLVKGLGRPLALTEYGISGASTDAAQAARLQADWTYLKAAFGSGGSLSSYPLYVWLYWNTGGTSFSTGAGSTINQMLGTTTQKLWKGIAQTASNQPGNSSGTGGLISGTPTTAVSADSFTVHVTDSLSSTATKATHLTIAAAGTLTEGDTDPLAGGTVNIPYTATLGATGGTTPYTFSVNSGSLPTGLSISGNTITGTPTVAATSTFVIKVTDNVSATALSPTLHITTSSSVTVTTTSLPAATDGSSYTTTLTAAGGTSPYTWALATGPLPDGVQLDPSTGIISGTPDVSGSFPVSFTVTDAALATATSALMTLSVAAPSGGLPDIGRQVFGGSDADWTFTISGGNAQPNAAATVTFYTASSGGSQITDLEDMSNSPISSVTTDSNGFTPQFQGPAGTFYMWADANAGGGPRRRITADQIGDVVTILHTYLKTLTG